MRQIHNPEIPVYNSIAECIVLSWFTEELDIIQPCGVNLKKQANNVL